MMLMKKTTWALIGILLITILLSGCIESNKIVTSESENLTIGALLPLTGSVASIGEASRVALEVSAEDINGYYSGLGSGKNVKLILRDTKSNPETALEQLKELDKMGLKIVVGPQGSTEAAAVLDYANQHGIVLLSTASTASALAIPDDNLYRLVPDDSKQGLVLARLMRDEGINTVIPMYRNDVWGKGLASEVEKNYKAINGTVLEGVSYETTNKNLSAEVEVLNKKVIAATSEHAKGSVAVLLCSYVEATEIFALARNYPALSEVKWYGNDGIALNRELINDKSAASFAVAANVTAPIYGYVGENDLYQVTGPKIEKRLGRIPESYALTSYDALWIATFVHLDAVPDNDKSIKIAMDTLTDTYYGISGWTILNDQGDRKYWDYDIWKVTGEDGTYRWEKEKSASMRGEKLIFS
ncbi:MAG: branched-chain amino acid transport system substrate-binding protein [Euryarchaeota archaeon]|nr:branched-chain amino acid transport system substrate-binding protein [Euryarchaeota archaeon]